MPRHPQYDDGQQRLDLTSPTEDLPASKRKVKPSNTLRHSESSSLIVPSNDIYHSLRQVVSDVNKFEHRDDTPYPFALLETSLDRGYVQLRPDLAPEQPLLPVEQDDLVGKVWERLKSLSDLQADVLDILTSTWLEQAKTANDRAIMDVDNMIALRGIKPKVGGQGRCGGYSPEQRHFYPPVRSSITPVPNSGTSD